MSSVYPKVPGYSFYPTEDEIFGYLKQRVIQHIQAGGCPAAPNNSMSAFFPDIHLCQSNPSDLPSLIEGSTMGGCNRYEWYFFSPRKDKGTNRTVPEVGYWKVTGRKQDIVCGTTGKVMGTKSILVFHPAGSRGSASSNQNGSWVVHEYHLLPSYLGLKNNIKQMPFVACCLKRNDRKACDNGSSSSEDIYTSLSAFQPLDY